MGLGKIAKLINVGKNKSFEMIPVKTLKVPRVPVYATEAVEAAGESLRSVCYIKHGFQIQMVTSKTSSLLPTSIRIASIHTRAISCFPPINSLQIPINQIPCQEPVNSFRFQNSRAYSLLSLNDLRDNKGATNQKTRKGRGIGSGKGKTAGRGHKGQKARGTHKFGFEGGQTPLRRRMSKSGFKNPFSLEFQFKPIEIENISCLPLEHAHFAAVTMVNKQLIKQASGVREDREAYKCWKDRLFRMITMKTLKDTGAIGKQIRDGVRLMGRGAEHITWPIHLEVSRVTARAKAAVEVTGGSVRRVYYNKLGFRALLKPEWFEKKGRLLPKAARPPPKQMDKVDSIGRLPAPTKPIPFTHTQKEAAMSDSPA